MRSTHSLAPIVLALLAAGFLPGLAAAQRVAEAGRPLPSDLTASANFGNCVDISGSRLLVGAFMESLPVQNCGAGYIYDRQPNGTWLQSAKLVASDAAFGDAMGRSVALVGDTAILGASDDDAPFIGQGSAYIFERQQNGTWLEVAHLTAPDAQANDSFGWTVALSPNGLRAAVGAPNVDDNLAGLNTGSAYLYEKINGAWTFVAKIWAPDMVSQDIFGAPIALRDDRVFVGAPLTDDLGNASGSVYVFQFGIPGSAGFVQKIVPTSGGGAFQAFGSAIDVSGDKLVVGASLTSGAFANQGTAYFFHENGAGLWIQDSKVFASNPHAGDAFGKSVSIDGDRAVLGAHAVDYPENQLNHGEAYLFLRQPNGTWLEADRFTSPQALVGTGFGGAVALDGTRIVVGGNGHSLTEGAAWVFRDCGPQQTQFGTGTAGCTGTQNMSAFAAEIGSSVFAFRSDHGAQQALGLGLIADAADAVGHDVFNIGILLHVDPFASATFLGIDVVSNDLSVSYTPVPLPNNPNLVGSVFYAQIVWAWTYGCDPLPGPFGLSSTRAVGFPILAP